MVNKPTKKMRHKKFVEEIYLLINILIYFWRWFTKYQLYVIVTGKKKT